MVSRQFLIEAIVHEINVCKHIFSKIPEGEFDFRFSDKQRSTLELMRYLASCGIGPIQSLIAGDWSYYDGYEKEVEGMKPEEFPAVMDRQIERIHEAFTTVSDRELEQTIVQAPGVAGMLPLGAAIMRTSYAWLVAYRMQFFLQAKGSGAHEIGTANNWAGVDWKPKAQAVEEVTEPEEQTSEKATG